MTMETSNMKIEERRHLGMAAYTLAVATDGGERKTYDSRTRQLTREEAEAGELRVVMYPWNWDYASVVAALVNARYDRDAMDAIVNNYLADPADAEHAAEMAAMQAWRAEAKAIATRALEETSTTR